MMPYSRLFLSGLLLGALHFPLSAFAVAAPAAAVAAPAEAPVPARAEARFNPALVYADQILSEDTVWRGEVLVQGAVTVAPQATLTVEPGAVVRFREKEGQAALLVVQGRIVAAGTRETPVLFSSAFASPAPGDWQGIMLLGSEKKNLLENCRIEGARTGVEALFSNLTLKNVRSERAGTGMRFQDALVVLESAGASDCETGLVLLESEATLRNLSLTANRMGMFARKSSVYLQEPFLSVNRTAFSCDNCRLKIVGGTVIDNGSGVTLAASEGAVTGAKLARNGDFGISLTASRIRVTGNEITGNRDGLLVYDGASVAWDNAIHDNGGYDLYNAGQEEFRAPGNWWGAAGPKIFDNAGRGKVLSAPQLPRAPESLSPSSPPRPSLPSS
ncbi:MAG TPA: hypothetical protein DCZ75_15715 [Geobacter sp.]|nr:hypothetical protein [Geobacter sp.]